MVDSTMDLRTRRLLTPGGQYSGQSDELEIDRSFGRKTAGMIRETDFTASVGFTRRLRLSQVTVRSLGSRGRLGPSPAGQPVSAQSPTQEAALDSVELLGTSTSRSSFCMVLMSIDFQSRLHESKDPRA